MVPDAAAVDAQAAAGVEAGDRLARGARPDIQVGQPVVVVREDLLLGPDRGGLEHPAVLPRIEPELEDVVVLVRGGHAERHARVVVAELADVVVVVEDQVREAAERRLPALVDGSSVFA